MDPTMAAKSALRRVMKTALAGLDRSTRQLESEIVARKIVAHPQFQAAKSIGVFLSMADEIDTTSIVQAIFELKKFEFPPCATAGLICNDFRLCFVPYYTKDAMDMLQVRDLEDVASLPLTAWNIRQPGSTSGRVNALAPGAVGLDLLIVPGLAFSADGRRRLGRGKGYYDRYLQRCEGALGRKPFTLAIGFAVQVRPDVPISPTDEPLDTVVHP